MKLTRLAIASLLCLSSLPAMASELKPFCDLTYASKEINVIHQPMQEEQKEKNTFFFASVGSLQIEVSTRGHLTTAMIMIVDASSGDTKSSVTGGITQEGMPEFQSYYNANSELVIVTCKLVPSKTEAP
jgi:3-keto-L-gulonate-6-phosphate decarboxylase